MSLTTEDSVKFFLSKETLTTFQSDLVQVLIDLIDGVICSYCGWNLLETSYVSKLYDGNGLSELDLKVYPVTQLLSVYDVGSDSDITSTVNLDSENGSIYYASGGTKFTAGLKNIKVSFTAGYTELTAPAALVYAANYLVAVNFNRLQSESLGVAEQKFNQIEVKYTADDLPPLVTRMLDRYRVISIF